MNEEEIIEIVKKEIVNTYAEGKAKAIQGLLDLYQKEKEKNKELEIKLKLSKKLDDDACICLANLINKIKKYLNNMEKRCNKPKFSIMKKEIEKLLEE